MYRVKTVVAMTGIPRNTLVAWERRYDLFATRRAENNYRVYSDDDVALLRRLKALVDDGLAISEAVRLVSHEGALGPTPRRPLWRDLLDPLLIFDRAGADAFARRVELMPVERAIDEVFRPLLVEVGGLWAAGSIRVGQEHFASAYVREALSMRLVQLDSGPIDGPVAACAGLSGDPHDIGLLMVAVRLALRGWRVVWVGANMPVADLCSFIVEHPPRLLCVGTTLSSPEVVAAGRQVRAHAAPETTIVVGGPGCRGLAHESVDRLWFCADERELFARLAEARSAAESGVH